MEVLHNMRCKGDTLSPKKIKNRLKTPEQVQALEKVYNEHKYPSEALKLLVANQIELSLKQVSRWFFHRRLKDKKLLQNDVSGNCKRNISGSLTDHNSGVEQESSSSSEQGDLLLDPKDVESKRSHGHHSSTLVPALQQKARCARVAGSVSSESGPPERNIEWDEREILHDKVPEAANNPKHFFLDENQHLMNRTFKSRGIMRNSRDHNKSAKENNAIFSAKQKLGEFYCEVGPPLCVHFDPLPPGAFNSSFTDSSFEPCQMGDSTQENPWIQRKSIKGSEVYGNYLSEVLWNTSYPERDFVRERMQGPLCLKDLPKLQLNKKACIVNHTNYQQDNTCQLEEEEDFGSNIFDSNCQRTERCFKYRPKVSQDEDASDRKILTAASRSTYFLENDSVILPRRTLKEEIHKKRRIEQSNLVEQQIMNNETKTSMGNGSEFWKKGCVKISEKKSCVRPNMGCFAGMETSLDDDEDQPITSSID